MHCCAIPSWPWERGHCACHGSPLGLCCRCLPCATPCLSYHWGEILERDKFDVDKFGSPTSYQIFPSILRMRCAKGQQPSRAHQEITVAIHYEATAKDLIPKISFISKDQFQTPPPLILALPKKNPSNYSPGGTWGLWVRCSVGRCSSGTGAGVRLLGQDGPPFPFDLLHCTPSLPVPCPLEATVSAPL